MTANSFKLAHKPLEFDPKRTNERLLYGFDFRNLMLLGEHIISGSWAVVSVRPAGIDTAGMLFGSPVFSGTQCTQMIQAGTHQTLYSAICTIQTNFGQTISENSLLPVTDSHYL
jgi:hypothetical protein